MLCCALLRKRSFTSYWVVFGDVEVESLGKFGHLVLHDGVPVVFYAVIAATDEDILEIGPAVLVCLLHQVEDPVFF